MATKLLTTFADPNYVQRTQLDGVDYLMWFQFNAREGRWYVDVTDLDNNPIQCGVKIVSGFPLGRSVAAGKPAGSLVCVDLQSSDSTLQDSTDPGLSELGGRFVLTYFEA